MVIDLISIVVPIYKVEDYLKKCVDSILVQTYKNIEIILVDDGSPDNCGIICDEYQKIDKRICVIHKENGGLSSARNAGLDISKGEYVVFVDSDDSIDNNYIEILYQDIKQNDADIAVPAFCLSYEDGSKVIDSRIPHKTIFTTEKALECFLFNGYLTPCVASKMWKKSLWSEIRCPEGKLFEDQYTTYKLLMQSNKVIYEPQVNYYYFKRSGSIGHSSFSSRTYDLLGGIKEEYENIIKLYPKIKASISVARTVWELVFINIMINSKKIDKRVINDIQKRARKNLSFILQSGFLPKIRKCEILLFCLNFNIYKLFYSLYKKVHKIS